MIRHIVFLKLKDSKSKDEKVKSLFVQLKELKTKIDVILELRAGMNISKSANAYDICLETTFNSIEDLDIYRKHSEHVKVLNFINKHKESIAVVDYNL